MSAGKHLRQLIWVGKKLLWFMVSEAQGNGVCLRSGEVEDVKAGSVSEVNGDIMIREAERSSSQGLSCSFGVGSQGPKITSQGPPYLLTHYAGEQACTPSPLVGTPQIQTTAAPESGRDLAACKDWGGREKADSVVGLQG